MNKIVLLYITILFFSSCQNKIETATKSANGIWESVGSGWILEIRDNTEYTLFDINSVACLTRRIGPWKELSKTTFLKNDTLNIREGVSTYQYVRTNELHTLCSDNLDSFKINSPIFNFDYFAETVSEHYAFMTLNNINWEKIKVQQRKKINKNSSEAELYLVIEETLELLNDNHAFLEAQEKVYQEIDALNIAEQKDTSESKLPEYGDLEVARRVTNHHLQEEMTKDSWLIQWGLLTDDIGFIQVKGMWLYADIDLPQGLIDSIGFVDAYINTRHKLYEGDYINKEVEGVRKIMNNVMKDLKGTEAIVIDVRFNGGGQDAVSCEILRNFSDQKTQVWIQNYKYGNKYTSIDKVFIKKSEDPYLNPVYVLTSPKTGSAAECFSLATMAMNHVKRIGDHTQGAMSTTLDKILPNGWVFSISNQVLMDNEGIAYENIGVPVNFEIDYPDDHQSFYRTVLEDLDKDKQNILKAIEFIEKNNKRPLTVDPMKSRNFNK